MSEDVTETASAKKIDIETIQNEAEDDLTFDILSAERASLRAPFIKEKYSRYLFQAKASLKKSEIELNQMYRQLHTHYTENHPKKLQRGDVPTYIKSDPKYIRIQARHEQNVLKVDYLENVLKAIDSMSFNLGNAIRLHIFMNGGA